MRKTKIILSFILLGLFIKMILPIVTEVSVADTEELKLSSFTYEAQYVDGFKEQGILGVAKEESGLQAFFDSEDVTKSSNITSVELEIMLREGLSGLGEYFIRAEQEYGVNAAFLTSLAALESAWGTSNFATERNNLFGFTAYDNDLNATSHFDSHEKCIMYVAEYLSIHYLSEEGKYFNGYSVESINQRYASDQHWYSKITFIANRGVERIRNEQ
jgi:beta-N-acetylglucosaminidase